MSYHDQNNSRSQATLLSRALVKYRKERGLTLAQLAKAVKRGEGYLQNYETGSSRPSPQAMVALGEVFGVDLVAAFPFPGTSPKELKVPGNVSGRLRHLIDLTCGGVQLKFAAVTGLTGSAISAGVNDRSPLSAAQTELVYRTLPELSRDWLARGKGEPFAVKEAVDEPLLVLASAPRKVVKRPDPVPDNLWGPRVQTVKEFAVFDKCKLTGSLNLGDLRRMEPVVLVHMAQTLNWYASKGCGLTPGQVLELACFLRDFAQEAGKKADGGEKKGKVNPK